jgi:hypothetical protein
MNVSSVNAPYLVVASIGSCNLRWATIARSSLKETHPPVCRFFGSCPIFWFLSFNLAVFCLVKLNMFLFLKHDIFCFLIIFTNFFSSPLTWDTKFALTLFIVQHVFLHAFLSSFCPLPPHFPCWIIGLSLAMSQQRLTEHQVATGWRLLGKCTSD